MRCGCPAVRLSIVAAMKSSPDSALPDGTGAASISRLIRVRGRVQGVYYRASAQVRARELGVRGYARNLPDGSVELLAHGTLESVTLFTQWLWSGSPASRVTAVEAVPHELGAGQPPVDFTTG